MKLREKFEVISVGDDMMAVPIGDGAVQQQFIIRLNDSAAEIFHMLEKETSEEAIVESLSAKYENETDEITSFVRSILKEFSEKGILS